MLLDYHNEVKIAFILSNIIHIDLQAFLLHAPVICNPYFTMYINNTIFYIPFHSLTYYGLAHVHLRNIHRRGKAGSPPFVRVC